MNEDRFNEESTHSATACFSCLTTMKGQVNDAWGQQHALQRPVKAAETHETTGQRQQKNTAKRVAGSPEFDTDFCRRLPFVFEEFARDGFLLLVATHRHVLFQVLAFLLQFQRQHLLVLGLLSFGGQLALEARRQLFQLLFPFFLHGS